MAEYHIADCNEKPTACFGDLGEFEAKIREIAEIVGLDLAEFEIDHLAVRVNTAEKAAAWKVGLLAPILPPLAGEVPCEAGDRGQFSCNNQPPSPPSAVFPPQARGECHHGGSIGYAELLKESLVNSRPIALIDLHQPLIFCNQAVSIIELPFPKDKTYPTEGWEHIEIVVPMSAGETVEQWIERLCKRWKLRENLQIRLKISEPKVAGERLPNPSIAISLADKTLQNGCCLKLHPFSIRQIVESETVL